MIFGNKQCEDNHVVSINVMNIKRVYATKFLRVYIDSHLSWCEHINHIFFFFFITRLSRHLGSPV